MHKVQFEKLSQKSYELKHGEISQSIKELIHEKTPQENYNKQIDKKLQKDNETKHSQLEKQLVNQTMKQESNQMKKEFERKKIVEINKNEDNNWGIQMKNKVLTGFFIILIMLFTILTGGNSVNAATDVKYTAPCKTHSGYTATTIYTNYGAGNMFHGVVQWCDYNGYTTHGSGGEKHSVYTVYSSGADGHDKVCRCGLELVSDEAHKFVYTPVNSEQCKGDCTVCSYNYLQNHNFVNNICTYCGYDNSGPHPIDGEGGKYLAVKNEQSTSITASITVRGVVRSETANGRMLSFKDEIPAGVTRVYIYYIQTFSIGRTIFLGYYDIAGSTAGTNGTLAIVAPYSSDPYNIDLTYNITYKVKIPEVSDLVYDEWTLFSGTNRTISRSMSKSVYLNTAVHSSGADYLYKGTLGSTEITSGTTPGPLEYGQVDISYTTAHQHSYVQSYKITDTTHIVVNTCSTCGDVFESDEESHVWDTEHKCVVCEYQGTHNYTSSITTAPTCTENGIKTFTCKECGNEYIEILPIAGHTWNLGYTQYNATQHYNQKCTVCSEIQTLENHNWNTDHKCTLCNYQGTHSYTSVITKEATCVNPGVKTYTCSGCTNVYTEDISAKGHSFTIKCPACSTANVICSVCGETKEHTCTGNYQVGSKYYATLKEAIAAVSDGGTIKVMQSNTDSSTATFSKNVTLNTNALTITRGAHITVSSGYTLNIVGSGTITTTSTLNAYLLRAEGNLVLDGVTLAHVNPDATGFATVCAYAGGTFTMNSGKVTGPVRGVRTYGSFNMHGGTVEVTGTAPVAVAHHGTSFPTVNITGGVIKATSTAGDALCISLNGRGNVDISNAELIANAVGGQAYGILLNDSDTPTVTGHINISGNSKLTLTSDSSNATGIRLGLLEAEEYPFEIAFSDSTITATAPSGIAYGIRFQGSESPTAEMNYDLIKVTSGTITVSSGGDASGVDVWRGAGRVVITGGKIVSDKTAVNVTTSKKVIIGTSGGEVSRTVPELRGDTHGLYTNVSGIGYFYDGILKAKSYPYYMNSSSAVPNVESGYQVVSGTEIINSATYKTAVLKKTPSLSASNVTVNYGVSNTISYSYDGDGDVIASTGSSTIASVAIDRNAKKLTINGEGIGTTTLTLTAYEGTNYATKTVTYTITVKDVAPVITSNPSNVAVKVGASPTFSVIANGTNLTYQWYYTNANSNASGTEIVAGTSGATNIGFTSPTLKLEKIQTGWNNYYVYCAVKNSEGTVKSNVAKITVYSSPSISTHPSNVTIKEGEAATFTVAATGGNPASYTYKWYSAYSNSNAGGTQITAASTGATISGVTSATLTMENVNSSWNNKYIFAEVNNGQYTIRTNPALLVVYYSHSITTHPSDVIVKEGASPTFTVVATDGNPETYTYQWYYSATNSNASGTAITASTSGATNSGYTAATLTLANIDKSWDSYYVFCAVSNGQYTVKSNPAKITISDSTPPTKPTFVIKFTSDDTEHTNGNWTNKETYTQISSTDETGVTEFQYSTDKVTWTKLNLAYSSGISNSGTTYTGSERWSLYERNQVFYFRAIDAEGNASVASDAYYVKYDLTAPTKPTFVIKYFSNDAEHTNGNWTNQQVYSTITSTDAVGVAKFQYTSTPSTESSWADLGLSTSNGVVANGTSYSGSEPWSLKNRNQTFYFRAVDSVGNASAASDAYYIKYDITSPAATLTAKNNANSVTLSAACTDNYGIIGYAWTNSSTVPTSWTTLTSTTLTKDVSSANTWYIWLKDVAGNTTSSNVTTYSITYNANGGSNPPAVQYKANGVALTLTSETPSRTNYKFTGWNTKADGTGTTYASAASYTGNASTTLYAQWINTTSTLTINPNGGSWNGSTSSTTLTGNVDSSIIIPDPIRSGYKFNGWTLSSGGTLTQTNYAGYRNPTNATLSVNSNNDLVVTASGTDPMFYLTTNFNASTVKKIRITLGGAPAATSFQIFFSTGGSLAEANSARATIAAGTAEQVAVVDFSSNANWTGTVNYIRLDPGSVVGEYVIKKIEYLDASNNVVIIHDDFSEKGTTYKYTTTSGTLTANWTVANYSVGDDYYATLATAYAAIGTSGTIKVEKNNTDSSTFTVANGKTITLELNGKTITRTSKSIIVSAGGTLIINDTPGNGVIQTATDGTNTLANLISNSGTLTVNNGTIHNLGHASSSWYAINGASGTTNIKGGKIKASLASGATSTKNGRCLYTASGTMNVSGGTIESSTFGIHLWASTGTINISGGTITAGSNAINISTSSGTALTGKLNITGGTLISTGSAAVSTTSTGGTVIGTSGGGVSRTSPVIQGATTGLSATNGFKFYDGILKGKEAAYSGAVTPETDYEVVQGTETISSATYKTAYLKLTPSFSVSPTSLSINKGATGTVTVTYNGDGTISATSSATGVATASVSGKAVTVKGVAAGTATITIKAGEGSTYAPTSSKTVSVTVYAQPTAPTITVKNTSGTAIANGNWSNTDVTITLSGSTLTGTGSVGYQYRIAGGSWTTYSSAVSYSTETSGTTFEARAYNTSSTSAVSSTASYTIKIDKTAPVITGITTSPTGYTTGNVTLKFSATDNLSGVNGYAQSVWGVSNLGAYTPITASTNVSNQTFATYGYNRNTVTLRIKDQAGNTTVSTKNITTVDRTAPIITNGTTHTVQEYYNNATKGVMVDSKATFSSAASAYKGGTTAVTTVNDSTVNSSEVLKITHASGATTSGYNRSYYYEASKVYVRKILAKIPAGYTLNLTGNTVSGTRTDITTSFAGTGAWEEYAYVYVVNDNAANTMTYGHAYISGSAASSAFEWYVASDTTYDVTNIFDDVTTAYSGSSATMTITAKDTQSGTSSITVNETAQTLTTSGTSKVATYTVSSAGTYTIVATDAVGNSTTLTKTAYTITYNGNGSTGGSTASQIKINGANIPLRANGYAKTNYVFAGWNTAANGSGTSYAAGASYAGDGNVTLYAQWTIDSANLNVNPNGGSYNGSTGVTTIAGDSGTTITIYDPVRAGYKFNGWTLSGGGTLGTVNYAGYGSPRNATISLDTNNDLVVDGTSGNGDISVEYKTNFSASTVKKIRITFDNAASGTSQIFFSTGASYSETNSVTASVSSGATNQVALFDFSSKSGWTGNLASFRIDIGNQKGKYTIKKIEYLDANNNVVLIHDDFSEKGNTYTYGTTTGTLTANWIAANYSVGNKYYATFADAYAAITGTSGTIKVENSNTDSSTVSIENTKTVTLDTNGKTITRTKTITNNGTLTITGTGKIITTLAIDLIKNNGTLTIEGECELTKTDDTSFGNGVIFGNGNLNITANAKISSSTDIAIRQNSSNTNKINISAGTINGSSEIYSSEANITGGTFTANNVAISNQGTGKINISNATISVENYYTITNASTGTINIGDEAKISGGTLATLYNIEEGTINISGGTITAPNTGIDSNKGEINITGGTITADSRGVLDRSDTTINITGGSINAGSYGIDIGSNGKLTLGSNDGSVSKTSPVIIGDSCAIYFSSSTATCEFYDGILKGTNKNTIISGGTPILPTGYEIVNGTETISGKTYYTAYLMLTPTFSVSPTTLSLNKGANGTITITYDGDGALSATSSATGVATATLSGKTVTVKGVAAGTATITIKAAEGTNYAATATKTVSVTVYDTPTTPTITVKNANGDTVSSGSWSTSNLTITLSGSTLSGPGSIVYQYSVNNGSSWTTYSAPFTYSTQTTGTTLLARTYNASATSLVSSNATFDIKLDTVVPTIEAKADNSSDGTPTNGEVSIKVTGKDNLALDKVQYSTDGETWTTISTSTSSNLLKNSDFSSTSTVNYAWDTTKNENTAATSWSGGYNGGVSEPTIGYHAHINTTDFDFNTLKFPNKNSEVGKTYRWLGLSQSMNGNTVSPNTQYTISYDVYSDTAGEAISVGLHHFVTSSTTQGFHSGLGESTIAANEVGKWVRKSYTFTTTSTFDTSKGFSFYIYGYDCPEGTRWVKNVQFEKGSVATEWAPNANDQTATSQEAVIKVDGYFDGTYYFRSIDKAGNVSSTARVDITIDLAQPTVTIVNNGESITTDPSFANGVNGTKVYNNSSNGNVTNTRVKDSSAPNNSGYVLHIETNGTSSSGLGGFYFGTGTAANETYVTKIVAKIPEGYTINLGSNATGTDTVREWLTSQAGTGNWQTYILYIKTGSTGSFSSTNFFYLTGSGTTVEWDVAYADVYRASLVDWTNSNVTVTGNAIDKDAGVVGYAFTTTETAPTTWTAVSKTTSTVTGTKTVSANGNVYFWAKDNLGNVSMTATRIERIDKDAPTITVSNVTFGSSATIGLSDSASGLAGYKVTTTNSQPTSWDTAAASQKYTPTAVTTYYVWAKDNAGNVSSKSFTVSAKSISGSDITITLNPTSYTFSGSANTPAVTVKDTTRNATLTSGTDYTVGYSNNTNAGTATVTVTGKGKYTGTKTATFTINAKSIAGSDISITLGTSSYVFDGSAKQPTVTVKDTTRNVTLVSGTDYTVGYSNNTNAGTATVTITGKGNYKDTNSKTFTITAQPITIPTSPAAKTYNGASQACGITTSANTSVVTASSTTSATDAGTYTVVYALSNTTNYKWSDNTTSNKSVTWIINKYDLKNATIANVSNQTYTGSEIKPTPAVTVPIPSGSTTTLTTTDFAYSYSNNINVGTATVKVTANSSSKNYTGNTSKTFTIVQKAPTFTVAPATLNIKKGATGKITITYNGDGALSASSSATGVATVSLSGKEITVTGVAAGTATITVKAAAGSNYTAGTEQKVTVNVYGAPTVPTITVKNASGTAISSGSWSTSKLTITLSGSTLTGPGSVAYQYSLDNGSTWKDYTAAFTYETQTSNTTLLARAVNGTEKTMASNNASFVIKLDTTKPNVEAIEDNGVNGEWTNKDVTVKVTGTDSLSGASKIEYSTNNSTWTEINTSNSKNLIRNSDFSDTSTVHPGWDETLNGTTQASYWVSGYNGGVQLPTVGYHAHVNTTDFDYNVIKFANLNNQFSTAETNCKNRWLGITYTFAAGANPIKANTTYTLSYDLYGDTVGVGAEPGLRYSLTDGTSENFHNGKQRRTITADEVGKWTRITYTFTTDELLDPAKRATIYIYGHCGVEGTSYVKNIQLEEGATATAWTANTLDHSNTTLKGNVVIDDDFKGTYYFRSTDKAGNVSTTVSKAINVDQTLPTITVAGITYGQNATLTIKDDLSGVKYFAVTTNTTAPTNKGTTNVTTGNTLNYWYQVANTSNQTSVTFSGLGAGTYYAWVKDLAGNYTYVSFAVAKAKVTIPSSPSAKTFNTTAQAHGISIPSTASIVTASSTTSATNAGTYNVVVKLNDTDNYTWSDGTIANKTISWVINKYNLSNATIGAIADQSYTGSAIVPSLTVTAPIPSGKTTSLVKDTDYTVKGSNNTAVGTGTVTITGTGNYTGTKEATFKIIPDSSVTLTVTVSNDGYVYTGAAQLPTSVVVKANGVTLTKDTDYTLSYSDNVNAGTVTVTATGKGNFAGNKGTGTYTISKASPNLTVSSSTLSLLKGHSGTVTITHSGTGTLDAKSDKTNIATASLSGKTVTIKGLEAGTATVTVSLAETANYTAATKTIAVTVSTSNYSVDGVHYETLADAYAAITGTEGTIVVEASNEDSSAFTIAEDKEITLDTRDKTITKTTYSIINNGKFIITGVGTLINHEAKTLVNNAGDMIIADACTISNTNEDTSKAYNVIYVSGNLDINANAQILSKNNRTIEKSSDSTGNVNISNGTIVGMISTYGGELNITGGSFTAINTPIALYENAMANISNSEISTDGTVTIAHHSKGTLNVNDGTTVTANTSIGIIIGATGGNVNINGGTIIASGIAIQNGGSGNVVKIGSNDGNVSRTSPLITGSNAYYSINEDSIVEFYDGILKGKSNAMDVNGTTNIDELNISDSVTIPEGYEIVGGTEEDYQTAYLKKTPTLSASNVSVTYGSTVDATYSYDGDGAITATSGATSIATVQAVDETNKKITIKGVKVGTATITVKAAEGEDYAPIQTTFTVTVNAKSLSNVTADITTTTHTYDGTAKTQTVKLTDGSYTLVLNTDYTVAYTNNVNAGTAKITVTGKGNYTGSIVKEFTINKAQVTIPSKPANKTFNNAAQAHGITIPSTASIVTASSTVSATNVGTYNVVVKLNDTNNYQWTDGKIENKTISWVINPYNLSGATIAAIADQLYTGSAIVSNLTVTAPIPTGSTASLKVGTDYTVTCSNNTEVGTADVKITGTGNYTGTKETTFKIVPNTSIKLEVIVSNDGYKYTGLAQTPSSVVVKANGVTLTAYKDYTLSYSDNVNAGTVTVTATGVGNYEGNTGTGTYVIGKASPNLSVSSATISLLKGHSETVTITHKGNGILSASSDKTSIATASLSDKTVTINGVEAGTATVTVSLAETANYTSASKTVAVTVSTSNYSVDGAHYATLLEAYKAIIGDKGTIVVEASNEDSSETTIATTKDITLDTRDKTITATTTGSSLISINGILTIIGNGTIERTNADGINGDDVLENKTGTININENVTINSSGIAIDIRTGNVNVNNGTIIGSFHTIRNGTGNINVNGGSVISNGAQAISNQSSGTISITGGNIISTTSQCVTNSTGTIKVTGGTIKGISNAIYNTSGTVIIGNDDGIVSRISPVLEGELNAISSLGILKFYDGILKGKTNAMSVNSVTNIDSLNVSDSVILPEGYEIVGGTEGDYKTAYLKRTSDLSASNVTLTYGETLDAEYTYTGDGKITATPNDTSIVTVESINETNKTIKIKAQKVGTTAIIISSAEGENYAANETSFVVTVVAKDLSNVTSNITTTTHVYDGTAKTQSVKLTDGSYTLVLNTDYTVTYANNVNAGTATVTVTGKGNYTGLIEKTFVISKAQVVIPSSPTEKTFNGEQQAHGITVPANTSIVTTNSTLNATNAGTYNVVVKLNDSANYMWNDGTTENKPIAWTINKYNLSNATIENVLAQTFTGSEIKPTPEVTVPLPTGSTTNVTSEVEYSYSNNIKVGTATVTVKAKDSSTNYTGSKSANFTIKTYGIEIPNAPSAKTYNGVSQPHGITIPANTSIVTAESTVEAINAGTYKVVIKLNDAANFTWSDGTTENKTITWTINKYDLTDNAIIAGIPGQTFTGSEIKPTPGITVPLPSGSTTNITSEIDYSYSNNINVGTATITVTAKTSSTNYTGSKSASFVINKAELTKPTLGGTYTYSGVTQTATLVGFDSNIMSVSGNTRIDAGTQGITVSLKDTSNYKWEDDTIEPYTISWTIAKKNVAVVWGETSSFTYTGSEQLPTVTTPITGVNGEKINISVSGAQIKVGNNYTATASISSVTGGQKTASNYELTNTTKVFEITSRNIADATVTLTPSTFVYDGKAKEPTTVVTVGGKDLTKDTEYTVEYTDNVNVGTATVKITGTGNYTGTVTKTFTITNASLNVTALGYEGTYDGAAHEISVNVTGVTGAKVTYATSENGSYSDTKPTFIDAGTYTVYYKVSKDNYSDTIGSEVVKINKREVALVWSDTQLVYNGKEQLPTVTAESGVTGETINFKVEAAQINVGKYKAVATIESVTGGRAKATNYKIAD